MESAPLHPRFPVTGNFQECTDGLSVRFGAGARRLVFGVVTSRRQRQIFSGVTGKPIKVEAPARARASLTAFSTAGMDPVTPHSPVPLTPIGFFVEGVGCKSTFSAGRLS